MSLLPQKLRAIVGLAIASGGVPVARTQQRTAIILWGIEEEYLSATMINGHYPLTQKGMGIILSTSQKEFSYPKGATRLRSHNQEMLKNFKFHNYQIYEVRAADFAQWAYDNGVTARRIYRTVDRSSYDLGFLLRTAVEVNEDDLPLVILRWNATPEVMVYSSKESYK